MKTGNVFAANPDAPRAKPANGIEQLYPRGTLDSISFPADVKNLVNGNTFTIQFVISGKCRIDFAPGDGSASVRFEVGSDGGKNQSVPVEKTYTYNTTFSSASQAFKPVKMQFKTVSPCVNIPDHGGRESAGANQAGHSFVCARFGHEATTTRCN